VSRLAGKGGGAAFGRDKYDYQGYGDAMQDVAVIDDPAAAWFTAATIDERVGGRRWSAADER